MLEHPFTSRDIVLSGKFGAGGAVQGRHGDCVFVAALSAVARTRSGKAAISQMIVKNSDGSFTITFPGNSQHPVLVTLEDLDTFQVKGARWAQFLETAFLISHAEYKNNAYTPWPAPGAADASAASASPAQYALYLLTGKLADKHLASDGSIGSIINNALNKDQPVIAFCANNNDGALVNGHEWTVIVCNPNGSLISLRNPWGGTPGDINTTKNGVTYIGLGEVTMSLSTFGQFFAEVTVGNVAIIPGKYYVLRNKESLQVLDVNQISQENCAPVIQCSDNGGTNQRWLLEKVGNGFYTLTAQHSGKALNVRGSSTQAGAQIEQYEKTGADSQQWMLEEKDDGWYILLSKVSALALTVGGVEAKDGSPILQQLSEESDIQKWVFELSDDQ